MKNRFHNLLPIVRASIIAVHDGPMLKLPEKSPTDRCTCVLFDHWVTSTEIPNVIFSNMPWTISGYISNNSISFVVSVVSHLFTVVWFEC